MDPDALKASRILIVDDQQINLHLLEGVLANAGYTNVRCTSNPTHAIAIAQNFHPDLVLLDLAMPGLDGFSVMARLNSLAPTRASLPILVLTSDTNRETRQKALEAGARDFVTKPFVQSEVLLRVQNILESRWLQGQLEQNTAGPGATVDDPRAALPQSEVAHLEFLERLSIAAERGDDTTGHHIHRVGRTSALLAEALGRSREEVKLIEMAAPLHDIGKIGVPDSILLKESKLTSAEFDIMKTHTTIGAKILGESSSSDLMKLAQSIALTHHERWDGLGYPQGLARKDIPLAGRIVAIADVYDALVHDRPYKRAWTAEQALYEIEQQRGRHFDPQVVDTFLELQSKSLPFNKTSALNMMSMSASGVSA